MTDKIIEELEELIKVCEKRIPNYEEACKDIMDCFKLDSDDGENIDKYNLKTYQIAESYHTKANDLICQIDSYNKAIEIVKKYENDGWVLCSDRLPKIESIFCNEYKDFLIGYGYEDGGSNTGFSAESENIILMDAVAWKPLPQPYKGE